MYKFIYLEYFVLWNDDDVCVCVCVCVLFSYLFSNSARTG